MGEMVDTYREAQAKRKKAREISDLGRTLETAQGRRLVWGILARANLFASSFVKGDSHAAAFNEGWRVNALDLFVRIMDNYPDRFTQMWREADSERKSEEQILLELSKKEEVNG